MFYLNVATFSNKSTIYNAISFSVQSAFFESEKGEESDHIRKPSNRVNTVQSVPVEGDEGDGVRAY